MRLCLILVYGVDEMNGKEQVITDFTIRLRHISVRYVIQYRRWWCFNWVVTGLEVVERGDWRGVSM